MKTDDKQKMCPNCHGSVPVDAETCLYCAEEFIEAAPEKEESAAQTTLFEHKSLQESLTSLYSPLYPGKKGMSSLKSSEPQHVFKQAPPLAKPSTPSLATPSKTASLQEEAGIEAAVLEEEKGDSKGSFWSILLLLLGGNVFTLGLMQAFFSEGNTLHLQWNTEHWYLYCLAALPLVFVGARLAGRLK